MRGEGMTCEDFEHLLVFYAWDELEQDGRVAVEEHTRQWASCAVRLAREVELQKTLAQIERPAEKLDPLGLLLAQCRSELEEALDDAAAPRG